MRGQVDGRGLCACQEDEDGDGDEGVGRGGRANAGGQAVRIGRARAGTRLAGGVAHECVG